MEGAGGQKAANYVHKTARPDGLTIGFWSAGTVPAAVLGQMGVLYDLDEVIFLGAHQTGRTTVFFTRKEVGLDSIEKLRSSSGLRIGAQTVGHGSYYVARLFAFVFGLKEPRWVTGYSGPESDVAILNGEIDSRASAVDQIISSRPDWLDKNLMHFHAIYEVPKGQKHSHPRFGQLPEFSSFAKSDRERKVLDLYRATQSASHPIVLPPKTPKETVQILRAAVGKAFDDPQFLKEYEKLTGEEPRPVKGEVLETEIKAIAGQRDISELLKKIGGPDPLPARQ
jgi:tripartite-type tricarboxylate transporter receptor subunit TctC